MLKGLGGSPTPWAEGWVVAVEPGRVSGQVAFPRSHLMDPASQEFGETHERVGG